MEGEGSDVCTAKMFSLTFFAFYVTLVDQIVLGPVSFHAVHCTAAFALQNGKFSMFFFIYLSIYLIYQQPFTGRYHGE